MSNILTVSAGELDYCPDCADIYGVLDGIGKRCNCERSTNALPGNLRSLAGRFLLAAP